MKINGLKNHKGSKERKAILRWMNIRLTVVFGMDSETIQRMNSMSQRTLPQGGQMSGGFTHGNSNRGNRQ